VLTVSESRDPDRPRSIDFVGTILIAVILAPAVLALSEGSQWGWTSAATIGCFILSAGGVVGFVLVEERVAAPLVDLQLLANRALVGATIAILIVAGVLNGLMYVLSLYFQDPDASGMSAFEAGLATLPASAVAAQLDQPARHPHLARRGIPCPQVVDNPEHLITGRPHRRHQTLHHTPIDGYRTLSAAKSCGSLSRRSGMSVRSSVTRRRSRAACGTSAVGVAGRFRHQVITRFRKGILKVGRCGLFVRLAA
jgi:hypothetical protein